MKQHFIVKITTNNTEKSCLKNVSELFSNLYISKLAKVSAHTLSSKKTPIDKIALQQSDLAFESKSLCTSLKNIYLSSDSSILKIIFVLRI
jgi:hypothetical protein